MLNPHEGSLITDPLKTALRQAGALEAAAQVRLADLRFGLRDLPAMQCHLHSSLASHVLPQRSCVQTDPLFPPWHPLCCSQVAADHAPALTDSSPTIQTVHSLWRLHK